MNLDSVPLRKQLLLFTGSYPYSIAAENTFVPQELEILRKYFDAVTVIPMAIGGSCESITTPNVVVDTSYARYTGSKPRMAAWALLSVVDPRLLKELVSHAATFLSRPRHLVRAIHAHVIARLTERWIRRRRSDRDWKDCVLYTWWFDPTTLGLAAFAKAMDVPLITRAHGRDLYENRHDPPYLPFRKASLEGIDLVFSASWAGAKYLADNYPAFRDKIRVSPLGVEDPGFINCPSTDDVFRIASCSHLIPIKRIDLMIRGIAALGREHPNRRIEWTHIGVGSERESLGALAASVMPDNVRYELKEFTSKADLYAYYRTRPVDLFLNTSQSEGTPVAIMEALSVGIPVVATAVGGNVEIVTEDNGVVIPANPAPAELADAIASLMGDNDRLHLLRRGSRQKWEREYSAARNYSNFTALIQAL